ncbi:hypothetical protein DV738_g5401, partial [Chaetothyriales sp. CBS 135597]
MASFLPSYFQKRLLRFALSNIDFIDSDALDLDNLGLTLGQRSVINIKDVPIKVSKLTGAINLPSNFGIRTASIQLLRVTVPADLHSSGIQVEIDGIDIDAHLSNELSAQHNAPSNAHPRGPPRRGDPANRPRLSSPSVHDPGGVFSAGQLPENAADLSSSLSRSRVLPTSEDLAASFLQSETVQERQELESVIGTRSHMLDSTTSSGDADDVGLGVPAGFTLPAFVATFFQGIADRLTVRVRNVSVGVDVSLGPAPSEDSIRLVLNVGLIEVDAVSCVPPGDAARPSSRTISMHDARVGLEGGEDLSSQFCSPKLSSRPSQLSASSASYDTATRHTNAASPQSGRASSLSSSRESMMDSVTFEPTAGLGIDQQFEDSAQFEHDEMGQASYHSDAPSTTYADQDETDNSLPAEEASQLSLSVSSATSQRSHSIHHPRELSESTLFSHEEAQSIYMSVTSQNTVDLSHSRAMPGAWYSSDGALERDESNDHPVEEHSANVATSSTQPLDAGGFSTPTSVPSFDTPASPANVTDRPKQPFLQLLHLNFARITIPSRMDSESLETSPDQFSFPGSLASQAQPDRPSSQTQLGLESPPIGLEFGDLTLDLDLQASRFLIRIVQTSIKALSVSSEAEVTKTPPDSTPPALNLYVGKILVNYRDRLRLSQLKETTSYPDNPILCLSIVSLQFKTESLTRRSLTVTKISLAHGEQPVLWFIDSVSVRDSIASSSMLRPHDVAVSISDRVEVQIKPVYIVVDLVRVDDVLSRSGGLSSLLDLGNSIMSTGTVIAPPASSSTQRSTTRSVRFNAPERRVRTDSNASGHKVNLRLSGSVIDLVGSEASIKVKSSALKLALRSGSARIVIDGAAVEGPILLASRSPPGVFAKLKGIEVQYSEIPKEADLDRLITLITPSSDKFDQDDDIMVDTLLRQRRKGAVLDLSVKDIQLGARGLDWHRHFSKLSDELSALSTVAKYLPEDDRPGILTFILIQKLDAQFHADDEFGALNLRSDLVEGAFISVPSLAAAKIDTWSLRRSKDDILLGEVLHQEMGAPMVMCRFIADEMEPTVRLKLTNCCLEYKVPTAIALSALLDRIKQKYLPAAADPQSPRRLSPTSSSLSDNPGLGRKIKILVALRHSAAALHPQGSPAKGLLLFTDALFTYEDHRTGPKIIIELKKAALLIINDTSVLGVNTNVDHKLYFDQNDQIQELARLGFVSVATISAALAVVKISSSELDQEQQQQQQQVDIEIKKNLLILETCADSTQTMIQILSSLAPPAPPSTVAKYRTEIVPIENMLASFTGNAFVSEPGPELGLQLSRLTGSLVREDRYAEDEEDGGYMADMDLEDDEDGTAMTESEFGSEAARSTASESLHIAPVELYAPDQDDMKQSMMSHSMLDFRSEHFNPKTTVGGTAHRWDSAKGTYGLGSETAFHKSPLKVRVRDMHVIWNMFDGYDWQSTRDRISQAVKDLETRAVHARSRRTRPTSQSEEDEEESVVGDVLFNSIYISIPAKQDPADLARAINHDIDDQVSETSYATRTTVTTSPSRRQSHRRGPALKLARSKQHKMSFELQGVSADVVAFPPGSGEVESSVDVRVNKLDIFDHVPTSTWKKFATYMHDAGEREVDTSQVHIELLNVRPVQELSATEMVLKLTVLPLRLHVDQDALDFLSRFFEFKDESVVPSQPPSPPPYLQRVEVNPIRLRLDYKPKTVDYASLRSGRTTEFMNFIVLDRADMVLRRTILYGVSGFERMGLMLNSIWTPDVKRNQLPGVLAGLAPVRPLVDVARGVNELIAVPIREYRKDGRIVRALQKGAIAFAKTTSTELANLGAKLAIGTQNVLQNAEELLSPTQQHGDQEEERKQISLYADQPVGIVQGLRGAYASLERDLLLARDAIVAVPGEVMAQPSATGAARAILKQSPTIILRPAMGVSKATAQTFQGVANTLDKKNLRRLHHHHHHALPGPIGRLRRRDDVDPKLLYPEHNISVPVDHFFNETKYEPHSNASFNLRFWFDATYYEPGGPVIVLQGGETDASGRLVHLQKGILYELSKATRGLGVVLEHRYYGTSFPVDDLSTENLRFLTTQQALADQAYFAANVKFPGPLEHRDLTARGGTPYIAYGGSYAGGFVSFLRKVYPDLTWGAISSSGVTAPIYDYWQYYEPIRQYGPPDCIANQQKLINVKLKATFGLDGLTYDDDFASLVSYGIGNFQSKNWDPAVNSPDFDYYCGNITSQSVLWPGTEAAAANASALLEAAGRANETDTLTAPLLNWIGWTNDSYVSACDDDTLDNCFGAHNASAPVYTDKSLDNYGALSWAYQVCTEWGYIQTGSGVPKDQLPLISRLLTLEYLTLTCRYAFNISSPPDEAAINQYGRYNISYPRLAQIGGEADPWRPVTPLASLDVPTLINTTSTVSEPKILIQGGAVHHWDENGLFPNETTPELPPPPVAQAQRAEVRFVQEWLREWRHHWANIY